MNNLIEYSLIAAIAGVVMLASIGTKMRTDQMAVASTQVRAGKIMTLDLAAALERDFRNVGANFPAYDLPPDSVVAGWRTDSTVNFFQFVGQVSPGEPPATIRYEWQSVDSALVGDQRKALYQISRYIDGTLQGRSAAVYTGISFDLLTDAGIATVDPDEVRMIDIKVIAISSLGSSAVVRENRWNAVYRPKALARDDANDV